MTSIEFRFMTFGSAAAAYLLAVTAAALTAVIMLTGPVLMTGLGMGAPAVDGGPGDASNFLWVASRLFAAAWLLIFLVASIPFAIGMLIMKERKRFDWQHFTGGAALTAIVLYAIMNIFIHDDMYEQEFSNSFWHNCLKELPYLIMSGVAAGTTCWLYLHRKFRHLSCPALPSQITDKTDADQIQ